MKERKTVLVVDDSRPVRDALTAAFEEAGYEVTAASGAEEVFRHMRSVSPAALLLDVYVPGLNGADVCRLVKAHPLWKRTYLVIMASRLEERESEMYRRLGADEVLRKPFDPDQVVARVEKALAG